VAILKQLQKSEDLSVCSRASTMEFTVNEEFLLLWHRDSSGI
jgi:hypothetical protein